MKKYLAKNLLALLLSLCLLLGCVPVLADETTVTVDDVDGTGYSGVSVTSSNGATYVSSDGGEFQIIREEDVTVEAGSITEAVLQSENPDSSFMLGTVTSGLNVQNSNDGYDVTVTTEDIDVSATIAQNEGFTGSSYTGTTGVNVHNGFSIPGTEQPAEGDQTKVTVEGNVSATSKGSDSNNATGLDVGNQNGSEGSVKVNGDVTAKSDDNANAVTTSAYTGGSTTVDVTGSISAQAGNTASGVSTSVSGESQSSVSVGKDINATVNYDGGNSATARGTNLTVSGGEAEVTVGGDVTATAQTQEGVESNGYTYNSVTGVSSSNNASEAPSKSSQVVEGDVTAINNISGSATGVSGTSGNGTVTETVKGNVSAEGVNSATGVSANGNSGVSKTKYDEATGVTKNEYTHGEVTVDIAGDVTAKGGTRATGASVHSSGGIAEVTVGGKISAESVDGKISVESADGYTPRGITGAFVSANTGVDSSTSQSGEGGSSKSSTENQAGQSKLTVEGGVDATGGKYPATGLTEYAFGSSTNVTVNGGISATSKEGGATGVEVSAHRGTKNTVIERGTETDYKYEAEYQSGDAVLNVTGDVTANGKGALGMKVYAGDGATDVTVNGGLSATATESFADGLKASADNSRDSKGGVLQGVTNVTVNGDLTVVAEKTKGDDEGTYVHATGIDAHARSDGAVTNVTVNGNASVKGGTDATGIYVRVNTSEKYDEEKDDYVYEDKGGVVNVAVKGNLTVESDGEEGIRAIEVDADENAVANIAISGDATAKGKDSVGLVVNAWKNATANVLVDGTLSGESMAIQVTGPCTYDYPEGKDHLEDYTDEYDPNALNLYVWKIEQNPDGSIAQVIDTRQIFKVDYEDTWTDSDGMEHTEYEYKRDGDPVETVNAETTAALEKAIWYIVKIQDAFASLLSAKGTGTYTAGETTYDVAHQDDDVTLKFDLGEDDELRGIQYNDAAAADYTANEDGSYTVKMLRGGAMLLGLNLHKHVRATRQDNVVAATCAQAGSYDEVVYCTECGKEFSRTAKTIEKLAHTPGKAVKENEVAATTSARGGYDQVVYCTVCGAELSRDHKSTAMLASEAAMPVLATELVYEAVSDDAEVNGVKADDHEAMAKVLETVGESLDGDEVTVEIPGVDKVLNAEEKARFDKLSVKDRLLVTLSALGFAEALDEADEALTGDAKALADDITARMDKLSAAEKQTLLDTIAKEFPHEQITVDGKTYDSFSIDVVIDRNGKKTYDRYTFYNADGAWKLYQIERGEYREVEKAA